MVTVAEKCKHYEVCRKRAVWEGLCTVHAARHLRRKVTIEELLREAHESHG